MGDRDEIKRLKKENRDLKKKLYKLEMSSSADDDPSSSSGCYTAKNYFSFLLAKARQKSTFARLEKYFKNSLLFTRIFKWGVIIFQYLQAGAFVILYTAVFIIIVPIILLFSSLTLIITLIIRSDNARRLMRDIKKETVFIIPTSRDKLTENLFLQKARQYQNSTVLVISPYFFKKSGAVKNGKMYLCYRKEGENVFILRNYFFFYFRRRLKKLQNCNITEIYIN